LVQVIDEAVVEDVLQFVRQAESLAGCGFVPVKQDEPAAG
jgi:hypothetical protein